MVTERNDFYYNLNHKNRGVAVIFNHEYFNIERLKQRSGTNEDEANLKRTLKNLGFLVHCFKDLTTMELFHQIEKCKLYFFYNFI